MKKFADWMYWKGTWWVVLFYLTIVPVLAVFCGTIGDYLALFFASLLLPWRCWMASYEREYKKKHFQENIKNLLTNN